MSSYIRLVRFIFLILIGRFVIRIRDRSGLHTMSRSSGLVVCNLRGALTSDGHEFNRDQPGRADRAAERLAYSVDEAAHLTGLSRDLLYEQMRRGNLSYVKVGRRRLITRQHLERFLGLS